MSEQNHNKQLSCLEYIDRDFLDYLSFFDGKSAPIIDDEQHTTSE